MYHFISYTRIAEYEEVENNKLENNEEHKRRKETGRYSVLSNWIKLPFIPNIGMSVKLFENSSTHTVMEVVYDIENGDFSIFFEVDFLPKEEYSMKIAFLLEKEGWEILDSEELKEVEEKSSITKKDTSVN